MMRQVGKAKVGGDKLDDIKKYTQKDMDNMSLASTVKATSFTKTTTAVVTYLSHEKLSRVVANVQNILINNSDTVCSSATDLSLIHDVCEVYFNSAPIALLLMADYAVAVNIAKFISQYSTHLVSNKKLVLAIYAGITIPSGVAMGAVNDSKYGVVGKVFSTVVFTSIVLFAAYKLFFPSGKDVVNVNSANLRQGDDSASVPLLDAVALDVESGAESDAEHNTEFKEEDNNDLFSSPDNRNTRVDMVTPPSSPVNSPAKSDNNVILDIVADAVGSSTAEPNAAEQKGAGSVNGGDAIVVSNNDVTGNIVADAVESSTAEPKEAGQKDKKSVDNLLGAGMFQVLGNSSGNSSRSASLDVNPAELNQVGTIRSASADGVSSVFAAQGNASGVGSDSTNSATL